MEKRLNILRIDGLQEQQERHAFDRKVQQKLVFIIYGNLEEEIARAEEIQSVLKQKNYKSTLSSDKKPIEVFETIKDSIEKLPYKVTMLAFPHLQRTPCLRKLALDPLLEEEKCKIIMVKLSLSLPNYASCLCTIDLSKDSSMWWPQLRKLIGRCAGEMRTIVAREHCSERLKEFNNILDRLDLEMSQISLENQIYARELARKQLCVTESTRCSSKVKRKLQCHASSPALKVTSINQADNSQDGKSRIQHTEIPTWKQYEENFMTNTANLPYGKDAHVFIVNGNSEEERKLAKKITMMLQLHQIKCISRDELQSKEDLMAAMFTSVDRSMVTIILNFTKLSGISSIVADYAFEPDEFDKKAIVIPLVFSRKEQKEKMQASQTTNQTTCAAQKSGSSNISLSCTKNLEQDQTHSHVSRSSDQKIEDVHKTPLERRRERQLDITTGQGELMEDEDWQKKVLRYIQEVQQRKQLTMAPQQLHEEKCRIQKVVDDLHLIVKTPSYRAKKQLYLASLEKRPDLSRFLSHHIRSNVQSLPIRDSSSLFSDTESNVIVQREENNPVKKEEESPKQALKRRPSSVPLTQNPVCHDLPKRSQTPEPHSTQSQMVTKFRQRNQTKPCEPEPQHEQ